MELGLQVQRLVTVPDGDPIRAAIKDSIAVSDVLIITGGLGPTSDDVTREATAEALGLELIEDEHAPSNLKQALHPVGAEVLENPCGTAPGVYVPPRLGSEGQANGCAIFLLPGPPREMQTMYNNEVEPRLEAMVSKPEDYGVTWVKFSGVGESKFQDDLDEKLCSINNGNDTLEVGYCARPGELDLRLIGTENLRKEAAALAIAKYPESYVSEGGTSLEQTVVELLTSKGKQLALAESCTGGRIASRITDVPGASAVFKYGFITYSNDAKVQLLKVSEQSLEASGAVSEKVAEEMAYGALLKSNADIAIAVTGIAGPGGGSEEKPVGSLWIGVSVRTGGRVNTYAVKKFYPHGRELFKQVVGQYALMIILAELR